MAGPSDSRWSCCCGIKNQRTILAPSNQSGRFAHAVGLKLSPNWYSIDVGNAEAFRFKSYKPPSFRRGTFVTHDDLLPFKATNNQHPARSLLYSPCAFLISRSSLLVPELIFLPESPWRLGTYNLWIFLSSFYFPTSSCALLFQSTIYPQERSTPLYTGT